MNRTMLLSSFYGALSAALIITTACSSSRKANEDDDDGDDSGSQSDDDGGTSRESDSGDEYDEDGGDRYEPGKPYTGGSGGSAGSTGGAGPFDPEAPDSVRCEDDGYCYWPDGHFCDPWGMCCYPDGVCEQNEFPTAGAAGIGGEIYVGGGIPVFPVGGSVGGSGIDPDDFTDEPWDPPIDDLEEPSWKDSGEPLCTKLQTNIMSHVVWSDSRGVFVLVSGSGNGDYYYEYEDDMAIPEMPIPISVPVLIEEPGYGTCVGEGCPSRKIYFNNGDGWEIVYQEDSFPDYGWDDSKLTGFDNGPLVVYGYNEMFFDDGRSSACGLATIEDGVKTCEPIYYVDDAFIVDDNLAYAIYDGDVIRYNGNSWGPLPGALSNNRINQIWANESHLIGTMGGAGRITVLNNGAWELMDTGTLKEFSSIWGFSETDLWAGTYDGSVFHCDGKSCDEMSWQGDQCDYSNDIREIWGSDGVVYFYTDSTIARVVDSEVEVLASFPCQDSEICDEYGCYGNVPRITSMWGNSPNEVFFTMVDESFPRRECGVTYVVWFDGSAFHQF